MIISDSFSGGYCSDDKNGDNCHCRSNDDNDNGGSNNNCNDDKKVVIF